MYVRLVGISLFICSSVIAQEQADTIVLAEVVVRGTADQKFLAGSKIYSLDSVFKQTQSSRHLGEVLSFQFPIYFRNYGAGMLSSVSMRGTSAQHTAVLWNGVNIASFSLGQADFSMLPSIAFNNVQVHEGGGSARFGSGAFGGTVLLSSDTRGNHISLSQEVGSFQRYHTSAALSLATNDVQYSGSFYHLQAENDFPIAGTDLKQDNASAKQWGTTQNLTYRISERENISLHYWYHDADRQIQPALGTVNRKDNQQDQNHRLIVGYESKYEHAMLQIKTGWIDDDIIYNGGKSNVRRWLAKANYQRAINDWQLEFSADGNHIVGNINEYTNGGATENRFETAVAASRSWKNVSLALNVRQPFISNVSAPLLFYTGSDLILYEKGSTSLISKVNASRNFRAPTLNDRYWAGAGNPDIHPESSFAGEAGLQIRNGMLSIESSGFAQQVDDWIQWKPIGEGGTFVPRNLRQVRVAGLQTIVSHQVKNENLQITTRITYQFVKSVVTKAAPGEEETIGKQLVYTPKHVAAAMISFDYRSWSALFAAQATDVRYTEDLNSARHELPAFALVDVTLGKRVYMGKHKITLQTSVKNVMNQNYMLYVARAQPGRQYSVQINYQLIPNLK